MSKVRVIVLSRMELHLMLGMSGCASAVWPPLRLTTQALENTSHLSKVTLHGQNAVKEMQQSWHPINLWVIGVVFKI